MTRRISKTSIRKVPFESEWQVKAYDQQGVRWPEADYFAMDLEDAFDTAKEMMKREEEKVEKASPVYSYAAFNHDVKGGSFYISLTTSNATFSVFLSPQDLLKLQISIEDAKIAQYNYIMEQENNG